MEFISLGASPCDETCAQVGDDNYEEQTRKESKAYINQLNRIIEKAGKKISSGEFRLSRQAFDHELGVYHEVVAKFNSPDGEDLAYWLEDNSPAQWDEEARAELGLDP